MNMNPNVFMCTTHTKNTDSYETKLTYLHDTCFRINLFRHFRVLLSDEHLFARKPLFFRMNDITDQIDAMEPFKFRAGNSICIDQIIPIQNVRATY